MVFVLAAVLLVALSVAEARTIRKTLRIEARVGAPVNFIEQGPRKNPNVFPQPLIDAGAPDFGLGAKERLQLLANGEFPGEGLEMRLGDTLLVTVMNESPLSISMHWHGITHLDTRDGIYNDGPFAITQSPIPPGGHHEYKIEPKFAGTYWYHSHVFGQAMDGAYGSLIVRSSDDVQDADREHIVVASEWGADDSTTLFLQAKQQKNGDGLLTALENSDALLVNGVAGEFREEEGENGRSGVEFEVPFDGKVLFRMINAGFVSAMDMRIKDHSVTIVAIDGQYVEPKEFEFIRFPAFNVGQRVTFFINTKADDEGTHDAYEMEFASQLRRFVEPPPGLPFLSALGPRRVKAVIRYREGEDIDEFPLPDDLDEPGPFGEDGVEDDFADEEAGPFNPQTMLFSPENQLTPDSSKRDFEQVPPLANFQLELTVDPDLDTGVWTLAGAPFRNPRGKPFISGNTDAIHVNIPRGAVFDVILKNAVVGHPMHPHELVPWVIAHSIQPYTNYEAARATFNLDKPLRRDTPDLPFSPETGAGHAVYRFFADASGPFLFHCHIVSHRLNGMAIVLNVEGVAPPPSLDFPLVGDFTQDDDRKRALAELKEAQAALSDDDDDSSSSSSDDDDDNSSFFASSSASSSVSTFVAGSGSDDDDDSNNGQQFPLVPPKLRIIVPE